MNGIITEPRIIFEVNEQEAKEFYSLELFLVRSSAALHIVT